jgi:hypothetical protein
MNGAKRWYAPWPTTSCAATPTSPSCSLRTCATGCQPTTWPARRTGGQGDRVGQQRRLAGGDGEHEPPEVDPGRGGAGPEEHPAGAAGHLFQHGGGDPVGGQDDHRG